jgi:hypothetical protein
MDTRAKLVAELEPKPVDYPVPGEVDPRFPQYPPLSIRIKSLFKSEGLINGLDINEGTLQSEKGLLSLLIPYKAYVGTQQRQ